MRIPKPTIPKEHGAWAVLLVPMLTVSLAVGRFTVDGLLLAVSALAAFMSYVPVHTLLRHALAVRQSGEKVRQAQVWAAVYCTIALACIAPLLMQSPWPLLLVGGLGLSGFFGNFFLTLKQPKTIPGDVLAVLGLTMGAPATYHVLTGVVDVFMLTLWLLNFLFFSGTVFYVHMKMRAAAVKREGLGCREKLSFGCLNLVYQLGVLAVVAALAVGGIVTPYILCAFLPMSLHALYGTWSLSSRVRFKRLGVLLLGHSAAFAVLLGVLA